MKYTCPISKTTVDEHIVRTVSFFVLILVILGFIFSKWIFLFLAFDFLARIFKPELSILKWMAILIIHRILNIPPKAIGAAPKRFAAGIGFIFSILIFILSFFNLEILKNILTAFFLLAAFLESFFSYCLGCKTYSIIQSLKGKGKKS